MSASAGYSSNAGEDDPIGYLKLDVQYIVNKAPKSAGDEASVNVYGYCTSVNFFKKRDGGVA